jgi:hypothetical protein
MTKRDGLIEQTLAVKISLLLDLTDGGAGRVRTCDPHNAIVVLYQLSYDPNHGTVEPKDKYPVTVVKLFKPPSYLANCRPKYWRW